MADERLGRVVVTGGAGFLGSSHRCESLVEAGNDVVCLDNLCTGSWDNLAHLIGRKGFRAQQCDASELLHVPGPVDVVLHFASPASPVDYLRMPLETGRRTRR